MPIGSKEKFLYEKKVKGEKMGIAAVCLMCPFVRCYKAEIVGVRQSYEISFLGVIVVLIFHAEIISRGAF